MPPVVITQRRLTLPARSDRSGAAFRNRWGTVSKEVGHRYDREPKSAPLPVETAPHFVRNYAPLPVGISAPFRPESAQVCRRAGDPSWTDAPRTSGSAPAATGRPCRPERTTAVRARPTARRIVWPPLDGPRPSALPADREPGPCEDPAR